MINGDWKLTSDTRVNWVRSIASELRERFICKFLRGQKEHGGDIGEVPTWELLEEMEKEALDQLAYVSELKRRYNQKLKDI